MTKESFEQLLIDLYENYQPAKKTDIPSLLEKYNGQEFDAVYHIFFKYNYPKSDHYNPELGTPQNIKFLIDKYSAGERVLFSFFKKEPPINRQDIEKKFQEAAQETSSQVKEMVEDKINTIDQFVEEQLQERLIQTIDKHVEKRLEEILKIQKELEIMLLEANKTKNKNVEDSNIEIKLNLLWTEKELIIPESISRMCIGTRFLVFDSENKFHGLEIKDITEDYISNPSKCIKEITIDKV